MNDGRSAVLGGSNAVLTTTLARGLRRRGWYVETHEGIEAPDLCVFVPDFGPPAPLIGGDAADWFDTVDSALTQAFVFA
jgi:hypothetical protein